MIYNNSYFNEQLKKTYIEGKKGEITLAFCVVIIALVTLVVHNIFYSMQETIVSTQFPHLTNYTIFSMISVYNAVIILFFVALCIIKYNRVTIAEISSNKWYLLIKTGHSPKKLVFAKLGANVLSVVFIYSLAFVLLIFLGALMKMEMHINAIFSLAMLGLVQVFFVVEVIMGVSVFVKSRGNCLFFVILGIGFMFLLSSLTGFGGVAKSVVKMENTSYLFTDITSIYIYILLAISVIMLFLGGIKGKILANNYKPKAQLGEHVYSVSYVNDKSKFVKNSPKSKFNLFKLVSKIALGLVVFVSILTNIGIIMLAATSSQESSFGNHIMLVFDSQTMAGEITKNDFVVFEKTSPNEKFVIGDVVLYYDNNKPVVQVVESINNDGSYLLDYINYPSGVTQDSHSESLMSNKISGRIAGKSSVLGAFLIWNKTIVAKILTTILPTLLLIFYDKIEKVIKFLKSTAGTDEDDGYISVKK